MTKLQPISKTPYYNTPVSEARSEHEIAKLLEKYGIKKYQWTTDDNKKRLIFAYQSETSNQNLIIKIPIPEIKALSRGRATVLPMKQRLRMIHTFLKALLEASRFGLFKLEEVFFGFVQVQLTDGKQVSTVDLLSQYQDGTLLLMPEEDQTAGLVTDHKEITEK